MQQDFLLSGYNYELPQDRIAQHPMDQRDNSRLLVMNGPTGALRHGRFHDLIDLVNPGDLLVVNDTRVFPARLMGRKESGGKTEVFLLEFPLVEDHTTQPWQTASTIALLKSSRRPRPGTKIKIHEDLYCTVTEWLEQGKSRIQLHFPANSSLTDLLRHHGQVPLPPYIERNQGTTAEDINRYQTVYARQPGAVAAPTAGLHFTEPLLTALKKKNVQLARITLHVGYGTFAPVRTDRINDHTIHREAIHISPETAATINQTRKAGGSIWAVGTTSVRALEYGADENGMVRAMDGQCDLYIVPGYEFKVIDHLITNFHLPQSSLLFLVSALCGRERLLSSYQEAIQRGYRFYSYGDAMALIGFNHP